MLDVTLTEELRRRWDALTEGERERSFDVTQFVVSGEPVELLEGLPMPGEEQGAPGATGTGTGTGTTGFGLGG